MTLPVTLPHLAGLCLGIAAGITLLGLGWQVASGRRSDDVAPGADVPTLGELQQRVGKTAKAAAALPNQLESSATRSATVRCAVTTRWRRREVRCVLQPGHEGKCEFDTRPLAALARDAMVRP